MLLYYARGKKSMTDFLKDFCEVTVVFCYIKYKFS